MWTCMDGCGEICQRQTEMEKARRPMFQQELEELGKDYWSIALHYRSIKGQFNCISSFVRLFRACSSTPKEEDKNNFR